MPAPDLPGCNTPARHLGQCVVVESESLGLVERFRSLAVERGKADAGTGHRAVRASDRVEDEITRLVQAAHAAGDDLTSLASLLGDEDVWVRLYAAIYTTHFDQDAADAALRSIREPGAVRSYARLWLGEVTGGRPPPLV